MSSISKSIDVSAPADKILGIVLNVETYPDWQREVVKVEVLEKDDQGRPSKVTMHVKAMGKNGFYTVQYRYPSDSVAEYRLTEGDMMTKHDASFSVVDKGDGQSELTVAMDLALVWNLPETMINQLILKGVKDMLKGIKSQAEQA